MNRRSETEARPNTPRAPNLRARIRETTAQTILGAAEEVFADAGLHAAHMGTIAAKAGVSVGTLYNHFEDREALLAGLLAARRAELLGRMDTALAAKAGRPLRERLGALLGAFLGHCEEHRQFVLVCLQREIGRYQQTFPNTWAQKTDTLRELYERIDREMKRGGKERALRPELDDLAPLFFMGMMRALIIRDVVFGTSQSLTGEADRLLDAFFDGVGTRAEAA
jgi:AcrR family transcriptional regulator